MGGNVLPPVEQVRPGLWSIPVPIPDNPLRYVLVYAFELDGGGVAIVDAGWNTDDAWAALNAGWPRPAAASSDVRAVLVTHIHPDHYGLAGRVREASGRGSGSIRRRRYARVPLRRHRRPARTTCSASSPTRGYPTTSCPTWRSPRWR